MKNYALRVVLALSLAGGPAITSKANDGGVTLPEDVMPQLRR
jgi:hypothetical protein